MTGVWMTSCPEAIGREFRWFLKKAVSWDLTLGEASPAGGYEMRGAFFGSVSWDLTQGRGSPVGVWLKDDVGTVSIVKIVPLSPRVEKLKLKKLINVSCLNNWESSVFRGFPFICIFYI